MSWILSSRFHRSLYGIVGVAGLIWALKRDEIINSLSRLPWLSDRTKGPVHEILRFLPEADDYSKYSVPGLQNLGNNCFLNVILQALASCSNFQPFLRKVLEESELLLTEETPDILPLAVAVDSLLEDLCESVEAKIVLNPRSVMIELARYIPNFNLSSQQDAAEAFLHLLSSLREEFAESYPPVKSPIASISASFGRIVVPNKEDDKTEKERWQKHFLGPFDGIIASSLTCQSCSSQISLDFGFFHTLLLSPRINYGSFTMVECTLLDCLKQFCLSERITGYRCSHCWHLAAAKYLSVTGSSELEIEKLKACNRGDCCDCLDLFNLRKLPWSNNFSHTLRQSSIARAPKILCIQLQRAMVKAFGEQEKLRGHISFPLVLDLSPFMLDVVGMKNLEESMGNEGMEELYPRAFAHASHLHAQIGSGIPNFVAGNVVQGETAKALPADESGHNVETGTSVQESDLSQSEDCLKAREDKEDMGIDSKADIQVVAPENHLYHLVSVVEHFGRVGSGHYTVYRRVRHGPITGCSDCDSRHTPVKWFCISDSQVFLASETDVLAAEASLLFYEKIEAG